MVLPEWFISFADWMKAHPYKTLFFIQIPICITVTLLTIKLVK